MRFLLDSCVGRHVAEWLRERGHDVLEAADLGPDPGDAAILESAAEEGRVLVTTDKDFGTLVFLRGARHAGVVRLPQVRADERIALLSVLFERHGAEDIIDAIVTLRRTSIRIVRSPQ